MLGTIKEKISKVSKEAMSFAFSRLMKEQLPRQMSGHMTLKAWDTEGNLVYSHAQNNVVVDSASVLLAVLLKDAGRVAGTKGVSYLAVGQGDAGWNVMAPPAPTADRAGLAREIARVPLTYSQFVNPANGQPSDVPTNIVDFVFSFNEGQAVGALVECGMFGGPTATATSGSGIMVNYRTFPVLNKAADMTFSIVFRITT